MTETIETVDAPAKFLADYRGPRIVKPGVYTMSLDDYHRDPVPGGSLSSTGARRILPPGCPARFDYDRRHGRLATKAMELGTAAHALVLGTGPELEVIDAPDRRTKAVKAHVETARADGLLPLLEYEYQQVLAMAEAIKAHPGAGALFDPDHGTPERSLFWRSGGIWRRARPDWMHDAPSGRLIVTDYKTCASADLDKLSRAMFDLGYHQQAAWYLDGVRALGLGADPAFVFVFQEKTPPYLVRFVEPDVIALKIGRDLNEQAAQLYRECSKSGSWPGYSSDVDPLTLPAWVENTYHWER